ncbi:hypothetical protein AVEN_169543-1 [Araneus ventricosus]|uniref:Integrase zinc-binding domain-containing protein n=1 Tax=Araneus ventricosus TaxID=182803 RepID=A0A4Y2THS6_ARAVE|nr:hypothetical protein AVEN_169543-1 [Araneus ventricosus]
MLETHGSASGGHFGVMKTLSRIRERFYCDRRREMVQGMSSLQSRETTQNRTGKANDWMDFEKLPDRTPRFPCCSLFGRPGDTPSSPNLAGISWSTFGKHTDVCQRAN